MQVDQVCCKLPPGLKLIRILFVFFFLHHLRIANKFTYCFQVSLWLFLQYGVSKELDGQCLCKVGQVRRLQKFCRRVHGHWQFAWSSLQQRKCQSYDGERKKNISAEKKDMNMLSILTTFKGTASWRSSIGKFLTTVLKDWETVDFDSNSSTVCSKTNTPLKP